MTYVYIVLVFPQFGAKPQVFGPFDGIIQGEEYLANLPQVPSGGRQFIRIGYDSGGDVIVGVLASTLMPHT